MITNPGAFNKQQLDTLRTFERELQRLQGQVASGVHRGYVDSTAADPVLPLAWTVTNPGAGRYVLTHNYKLANPERFVVKPTVIAAGLPLFANVKNVQTNSFEVNIYDNTGLATNCAFQFEASHILE